ncbi:SMP-30/gluconolactonase/LRE family protein, partial [Streptomyces hayashii]
LHPAVHARRPARLRRLRPARPQSRLRDVGEGPDGICVDARNAVWYADVPHRRCVRVAEGGTVTQTVPVDRGCFACALGGPDGTTLFVVAAEWRGMTEAEMVAPGTGTVLTLEVAVPGAGWP